METQELTSDVSRSGSALDSDKAEKKAEGERSGKWGAKADAVVEVISQMPDYFFQADTGSTIHLVWTSDCCVNRQESHIMIRGYNGQPSAST